MGGEEAKAIIYGSLISTLHDPGLFLEIRRHPSQFALPIYSNLTLIIEKKGDILEYGVELTSLRRVGGSLINRFSNNAPKTLTVDKTRQQLAFFLATNRL